MAGRQQAGVLGKACDRLGFLQNKWCLYGSSNCENKKAKPNAFVVTIKVIMWKHNKRLSLRLPHADDLYQVTFSLCLAFFPFLPLTLSNKSAWPTSKEPLTQFLGRHTYKEALWFVGVISICFADSRGLLFVLIVFCCCSWFNFFVFYKVVEVRIWLNYWCK